MKNKVLNILKNSNDFVSGEKIGNLLGISRAAINKHIKNLREEGCTIESVTNKGYRLTNFDILDENLFKSLNTEIIGKKILYFEKIDSTNNKAKSIADKENEGTIFVAKLQTNGRGRVGRSWVDSSSNIALSIVLKPDLEISKASQITLLAGIAVSKILPGSLIKWPNDIVINGKKVCGILTEIVNDVHSENNIIVGIGINVNNESFNEDISEKATSLFLETGKKYSRVEIIEKILYELDDMYKIFKKQGIFPFINQYKNLCVNIGKEVCVSYSNKIINGIAVDVSENGELLVKTANDEIVKIFAGEVLVRGVHGYI